MKFTIVAFLSYASSAAASSSPTTSPSASPTTSPSNKPSLQPSSQPSMQPSSVPSFQPSSVPSFQPSSIPSLMPSDTPSLQPSSMPSDTPSLMPSDTPSLQPSSMPSETPSLMPSETPSLKPSSMPSETPSLQPSSMPSETPSCTPSQAPTPSPSINLFYPDQKMTGWETGCLNDGGEPAWMDQNPSYWLFSTLDRCCAQHFSWNYDYCMGIHDDTCARAYWYPDWVGQTNTCIRDGEEPLYMTYSPGRFLFTSKTDCCQEHYSWDYDNCIGDDSAGSGKLYYPDWTSGNEECKNDGEAPDYMIKKEATWMYSDKGDCCKTYFNYKLNDCMGTSSSNTGSGKYFPDWHGDNEACLQDTGTTLAPDYMEGSNWLFDDLESCCDQHYSYEKDTCMGTTGSGTLNGSEEFYVLWQSSGHVCVKNCEEGSGTNCGGFAKKWDTKYDSQETCCSEMVSYDYKNCMKGI